jgi:hypothetical protein
MELLILQFIAFFLGITNFAVNIRFIDFDENLPIKIIFVSLILGILFSIFIMPMVLTIIFLVLCVIAWSITIGYMIFAIRTEMFNKKNIQNSKIETNN